MSAARNPVDILVVGGGVNGVGIARDAVGRGATVVLCEQGDLAGATSSASTKLFHGGLRYLEFYEFGLVRKALIEREVLLSNMPHISQPMRFVLPHARGMRPAWLLRLGLFLYDHLDDFSAGRKLLPGTKVLDLRRDEAGKPLKAGYRKAFEYSDGWVDDARLVVLNARDAATRGARILTRTRLLSARRQKGVWHAVLEDVLTGARQTICARALVNAAGPWVNILLEQALNETPPDPIRLVRGSHIVVPKLFDHARAYFFQNPDGRIIFAIPFQEDFTLIGTTDADHHASPAEASCTDAERAYLCDAASEYFEKPVRQTDIVWTYAGVRPLEDAGAGSASKASRDYHLRLEGTVDEAPLLSVYGGKITTFRKLSEQAVDDLSPRLGLEKKHWTARAPLPGGDFPFGGRAALEAQFAARYPFLDPRNLRRLVAAYGTDLPEVLGEATTPRDLGEDFGAGLFAVELRWLCAREWARTAEDIVWRRTKCGLRLNAGQVARIEAWLKEESA